MSKKVKTMSAVLAAVMLANVMPAQASSADDDEMPVYRINKPYITIHLENDYTDEKTEDNWKWEMYDTHMSKVANGTFDEQKSVTTYGGIYDISKMHDYDTYISKYALFLDIDRLDPQLFRGKDIHPVKDPTFYLGTGSLKLGETYYYEVEDPSQLELKGEMTVNSDTIIVDVDKKHSGSGDTFSRLQIYPSMGNNAAVSAYENEPLYFCDHGGETIAVSAPEGEYDIDPNVQDGPDYREKRLLRTYGKKRDYVLAHVKVSEYFPTMLSVMNEDLTFDKQYEKSYSARTGEREYAIRHYDARGDDSGNVLTTFYVSGSVITAAVPDAEGYVDIWLDAEDLKATMFTAFSEGAYREEFQNTQSGDIHGCEVPMKKLYFRVPFRFPQNGFSLYNVPADSYKMFFRDKSMNKHYAIVGDDIVTTDDKQQQVFNCKVIKRDLKLGDINNDGDVNVTDVVLSAACVKGVRGLDVNEQICADIKADGNVDVTDLMSLAAQVKGIRPFSTEKF
ncbi:dockerin type I repeat-containing protein [Ruminococcus sp.]|uniref:dockerin type I repeat-containing protein n=1 Tax=Ruminococcus sp. TaxID=41978 RepID=UPI0025FD2E72|nr:dockerin type I repeat-containing protein [Ruminococcus sp.]MBQ8965768.1 dockerin type I repeat-containing protein [Ruminococcus sp.]